MGSVNTLNPNTDRSVKIFDEFYDFTFNVQGEEYDAVFSYFKSIYTTKEAAGNFTVTLFRVAALQNVPVMSLLAQLQGANGAEVSLTLAYYLNNVRSSSTLLGVAQPTQPNYYVARNVRA